MTKKKSENDEFGQALPDQLTWTHHVLLAQLIDQENINIKQWYAEHAAWLRIPTKQEDTDE